MTATRTPYEASPGAKRAAARTPMTDDELAASRAKHRADQDAAAKDKKDAETKSPARRSGGKRRSPIARARRVGARHAPTAIKTSVQIWHVLVVSLMMVVLYLALTSAKGVVSGIGGIQTAVKWLVSPTATI